MDKLQRSTKSRLAQYRARAAAAVPYAPARDWRYWKSSITGSLGNARGKHGEIYTDNTDQYGDYLGDAHDMRPRVIDHKGWYADNFCGARVLGGVARPRAARGTYYIPVTRNTGCDGTTHWLKDAEIVPRGSPEDAHELAIRDAAQCADSRAQFEAEECQKDDAQYRAEADIEQAVERIHDLNKEGLALIREIKTAAKAYTPAVCKALRSQVSALLNERVEQFRMIEARRSDFWTAVQS